MARLIASRWPPSPPSTVPVPPNVSNVERRATNADKRRLWPWPWGGISISISISSNNNIIIISILVTWLSSTNDRNKGAQGRMVGRWQRSVCLRYTSRREAVPDAQ